MATMLPPRKSRLSERFAFSTWTALLSLAAVASSLVFVHDLGKQAIPIVEWVCGTSAVLLLIGITLDSRRH